MRFPLTVLVFVLAAGASADRLILIPTGKKVPLGVARLEHMFDQGRHERFRSSLAVGLTEAIDAELTYEEDMGSGKVLSWDVAYNFVPPVVGISPGLSVGIRDVSGKTRDGRYAYIALTERVGLEGLYNAFTPAEVTLGYAHGDVKNPFVGAMIPFRESFRMMVEYDTRRVAGGLEFRPVSDVWIRWIHRQDAALWSVTVVARF